MADYKISWSIAMPSPLQSLFGARPRDTVMTLIFLSVFVGALMAIFHISPPELYDMVIDTIERLLADRLYLVRQILRYFVYGLMVVVPIWLILRLINIVR
jgi:hypothetical protein